MHIRIDSNQSPYNHRGIHIDRDAYCNRDTEFDGAAHCDRDLHHDQHTCSHCYNNSYRG